MRTFPAARLNITWSSPAPKANDDLAKAKFFSEMAKAKNAPAFGVGWSVWFGHAWDTRSLKQPSWQQLSLNKPTLSATHERIARLGH
jgi:hypothetical protein